MGTKRIIVVALGLLTALLRADGVIDVNQESLRIWLPEPDLSTAIVCPDNDVGCAHPNDPDRHREVALPEVVQAAIYGLTYDAFLKRLYGGPTLFADIFGPIYRLTLPDRNGLFLYVYQMKEMPAYSFRYYSFALLLHDTKANLTSSKPVVIGTDSQDYCPRPWIRFADLLGDESPEIVFLTGDHRGTNADYIYQHVLTMGEGVQLKEMLSLKSSQWTYRAFAGDTHEERQGFVVRTLEKGGTKYLLSCVSYSRNKFTKGPEVVGYESFTLQANGDMKRTNIEAVDGNVDADIFCRVEYDSFGFVERSDAYAEKTFRRK